MASVNKVILVGNLGADPEVRYLNDGSSVVNFSIATSDKWKDKAGEAQERTEWHKITMFGKVAEIAGEYLKKGSSVYLEGKIQTDKWQDKEGHDRYTTKIIAHQMQMLGGRADRGDDSGEERAARTSSRPADTGAGKPAAKPASRGASFDDMDDDIPFLFNLSSVSDTLGLSKSRMRIKNGPKTLSVLQANAGCY